MPSSLIRCSDEVDAVVSAPSIRPQGTLPGHGEFITDLDKAIARPARGISVALGNAVRTARDGPERAAERAVKCFIITSFRP